MRKLLLLVVAALLLPATAAAQKGAPARHPSARAAQAAPSISLQGAQNLALGQVRQSLLERTSSCCDRMSPRNLRVVYRGIVIVHWQQLYIVAIETPGVMSHMRVLIDPATARVVDLRQSPRPWTLEPAYWRQGLNAPSPVKR